MARSVVLSIVVVVTASVLWAAPPDIPISGRRFEQQLAAPVTATWNNVSFRKALQSLQDAQQVALVLDRRIDADAPFAFAADGDTLELTLARIAQRKQIGCTILAPVVYFGPQRVCEQLQTVAALRREDIGKLPASPRRLLSQSKPGGWPRLAQPAKLVAQMAEEARVKVENLETVPHDLWAEANLPVLPWSDRLTLILAQFNLTFEVTRNGRSITLVPIPNQVAITRSYAGGDAPRLRMAKLKQLVPNAQIDLNGTQLVVVGRNEDHHEVATLLAGKQVRKQVVSEGQRRYKLKVAGLPLENVFAQLGKMLKLEIRYDRDAIDRADISLKQLISFDVADATLEELLTAALNNTGLTHERTGTVVTIRPAK